LLLLLERQVCGFSSHANNFTNLLLVTSCQRDRDLMPRTFMPVPAAVGSKPSSRPRRSSLEGTWSSTWAFTAADDDADVVIEGILIQAAVRPAHLASLGDDRDVPRDGARGDKPRKRRSLYNARHNKAIMEGAAAAVEVARAAARRRRHISSGSPSGT